MDSRQIVRTIAMRIAFILITHTRDDNRHVRSMCTTGSFKVVDTDVIVLIKIKTITEFDDLRATIADDFVDRVTSCRHAPHARNPVAIRVLQAA